MHAISLLPLAALFDAQLTRWVVWVGLVVLTIALLLLVRTRWGQSQPLRKCVVLSLVAHLLLAIYISTVNIVTATIGSPEAQGIQVALVDRATDEADRADGPEPSPWDAFVDPSLEETLTSVPDLSEVAPAESVPDLADPQRMTPVAPPAPSAPAKPAALPATQEAGPPQIVGGKDAPPVDRSAKEAQPIDAPPPVDPNDADLVPPPERQSPANDRASGDKASTGTGSSDATSDTPDERPKADAPLVPIAGRPDGDGGKPIAMPEVYKLRTGDHAKAAKGTGATHQSEAAVNAALKWLAANQSPGGRWSAGRTGAGVGRAEDGQDRLGAGMTADTGITGLALLAFLAAGNTHLQGEHQLTVRHGLEYLLGAQEADGNLGATRNMYEKMYCHAMATCALSEAYAMSRDKRLRAAVRSAIDYTLNSQDHTTGGWRYRPGDPGDTSQLGWQVMALKSAQLGGFDIPDATRSGIERFLKSVTLGHSSGLACYQPVRPVPTRSMTAEALVCRQFLSLATTPAALAEASDFVLQEVPGAGTPNYYYWYYATLAMYQTGGEPWRKWDDAMQKTLLPAQRTKGDLAGSWDPDPVWGRCGGRAYSTALGALCLEIYYRFLPLYVEAAGREARTK